MGDLDTDLVIKEIDDKTVKENYTLKILVVGESSVGKTNIIQRYVDSNYTFLNGIKATVGVGFSNKTYKINQDVVKMVIWDTAGQERYRSITRAYYKGSQGVLIVYDITNKASFDKIESWLSEVKESASNDIKYILVGNKCDLNEIRKVSLEEAKEKAKTLNCPLIETSVLNNTNVEKAFKDILIQVYIDLKLKMKKSEKENVKKDDGIQLDVNNEGNKEEKCRLNLKIKA